NGQPASTIWLGGGARIIADPPAAGAESAGIMAGATLIGATEHPANQTHGARSSGIASVAGSDSRLSTSGDRLGSTSVNMSAATSYRVKTAMGAPTTGFTTGFQTGAISGFDPEDIVVFDAAGVRDEVEIAPSKAARSERQQAELVPISLNTSGA